MAAASSSSSPMWKMRGNPSMRLKRSKGQQAFRYYYHYHPLVLLLLLMMIFLLLSFLLRLLLSRQLLLLWLQP